MAGVHLGPHPLRRPVGLEERARVAPRAVDLVFVGVDVVGLGVGRERLVDQRQRVGVQLVVVVEQGDELARAPSPARRWRRRRCRRSRSRRVTADAGVARGRARRASRAPAGRSEQSSTRQSSQSPKLWRAHRLQHRPQHVGRRFVDRREDREAGGRHSRSAPAAEALRRPARSRAHREMRDRACQVRGGVAERVLGQLLEPAPAAPSSASLATSRSRSRRISSFAASRPFGALLRHRRRVYPRSPIRFRTLAARTGKSSGCSPSTWP